MAEQNTPGPLLTRYLAGQHEAVWNELRAMGDAVREIGVVDDAWAVACETMRRARQNVERIVQRLDRMGYRFWDGVQGSLAAPGGMVLGGRMLPMDAAALAAHALSIDPSRSGLPNTSRHIAELQGQIASLLPRVLTAQMRLSAQRETRQAEAATTTDHLTDPNVFSPADEEDRAWLGELEGKGMLLPMSLRAWFEIVGDVNLAGAYPGLCFWEDAQFPGVYADPLGVELNHFRFLIEAWLEEHDEGVEPEPVEAVISLSPELKAGLAVTNELLDDGYTLELPAAGADGLLVYRDKQVPFVDFLRHAFRWGGFPGWADQPSPPSAVLARLSDQLLPL